MYSVLLYKYGAVLIDYLSDFTAPTRGEGKHVHHDQKSE